jgi:uncharacterized protein (DUF488 family)
VLERGGFNAIIQAISKDNQRTESMRKLYTIGYEAAALDDFIATLTTADVDTLVDVRELPMSRRRGFSKTALSAALKEAGIEYLHVRELGSPRDMRHRLREDKDYKIFFKAFNKYLTQQQGLLRDLATEFTNQKVAFMCYEKQHTECHRSSVADAFAKILNITPQHLGVTDGHLQYQTA